MLVLFHGDWEKFKKKLEILAEITKKNVLKSEIPRKFNIKKSILFTILKSRDTISAPSKAGGISNSSIHLRDRKFPILEKALIK